MIHLPALVISGAIFAVSYLVVTARPIPEAIQYGFWALGLQFLANLLVPSGTSIFSNFKLIATVFIGINLISQARFRNDIKHDILISGVSLGLSYLVARGLIPL